jgi:integrase
MNRWDRMPERAPDANERQAARPLEADEIPQRREIRATPNENGHRKTLWATSALHADRAHNPPSEKRALEADESSQRREIRATPNENLTIAVRAGNARVKMNARPTEAMTRKRQRTTEVDETARTPPIPEWLVQANFGECFGTNVGTNISFRKYSRSQRSPASERRGQVLWEFKSKLSQAQLSTLDLAIKKYDDINEVALQNVAAETHAYRKAMAVLFVEPLRRRVLLLKELARRTCIQPSTTLSHWIHLLMFQRLLGIQDSAEERQTTKAFEAEANLHRAAVPRAVCANEIDLAATWLRQNCTNGLQMSLALRLAFVLGQRISDLLQIEVLDIEIVSGVVTIVLRYTKTSRRSKPNAIWIPKYFAQLQREVWELASNRRLLGRKFLFLSEMTKTERQKASCTISRALTHVDPALSHKGVRRGGLQAWARAGTPAKLLCYLSGHKSEETLARYLNWNSQLAAVPMQLNMFAERATQEMQTRM